MVSRNSGWHLVTLAVAGLAAASALPAVSFAQGNLVWGGNVPPPPKPGEAPVYVPSPAYSSDGFQTPNQSNFSFVQPTPPQFLPPPVETAPAAAPLPPAALPEASVAAAPAPVPPAIPQPGPGDYGRTFPVQESASPQPAPVQQAALPPLTPGVVIDDAGPSGVYGAVPEDEFDPWEGLTEVTPGTQAVPAPAAIERAAPTPAPAPAPTPAVPSYAALERVEPARPERGWSWNPFRWGRGSLADRTPSGYRALPRQEAACRRELQKRGVQFTDAKSVGNGRSHGIQYPVRVSAAAKGIAMQPPALLSCATALQTARWLDEEVRPAARWTLWKQPAAIINASSYRVSRIAGSRTISEHALGNALDIRGLRFTDGSTFLVEPKGAFSPLERRFQNQIRQAGCKYFGTVLGPGYNKAHADHFHFDVKSRMRPVCK